MPIRTLLLLGLSSLTLVACSSRAVTPPAVDLQAGKRIAPTDTANDSGVILVWARNDEREEKTFRLAADVPLRVIEEVPGIVIATRKGEMKWKTTEKEINLAGCSQGDGVEPTPSKGTITFASLVPLSGEGGQQIVDPSNSEGDAVQDLQHSAGLVGSIGPYLFIQEGSYVYACGAHGGVMASAMVWDADQGKAVDLLAEMQGKEALAAKAKKMLEEGDEGSESDENPAAVLMLPVFGDRGALRIDVQFAGWACYACSDGQWSSYTRSVHVPTDWMPERLRAWAVPPVAVKEFGEKYKAWHIKGWSKN